MNRLLLPFLAFVAIAVAARDIADKDAPNYTFEEYLKDWDKSYPSHLDYSMHKQMFETRKASIIQQNSDPKGLWKAGFNKFTDMTEQEFKAYRGYNLRMGLMSDAPTEPVLRSSALPTSVDWRTVPGVLTPVKDQGQCGSCWAFSATENVESAVALATNQTAPVLSPQNVVSCTPNPNQCGGTGGCGGATAELGIGYVAGNGIYFNANWPYTATNGTCTPPPGVAPAATCSGYKKVIRNSYEETMYAVVNQPISVSVDASTWGPYTGGIFNCTNSTLDIDHVVQLVGYGSQNGVDYWIVRNSWGTSWGEAGYIRLLRHADGSHQWCWPDDSPQDGSGCDGGPDKIIVCGTCGIWYDNCYPYGGKYYT